MIDMRARLAHLSLVIAAALAVVQPVHAETVVVKATGRVTAVHESKNPYLNYIDIGSLIAVSFKIDKTVGDVDAEAGVARYPNIISAATCVGGTYRNFEQNVDRREWYNGTWILDDHVEARETQYRDSFEMFLTQSAFEPGLKYRIEASIRLLDKLRTKKKSGPLNGLSMPATPPSLSGFRVKRLGRVQWLWDDAGHADWVEFEVTKLEVPDGRDDGCPKP